MSWQWASILALRVLGLRGFLSASRMHTRTFTVLIRSAVTARRPPHEQMLRRCLRLRARDEVPRKRGTPLRDGRDPAAPKTSSLRIEFRGWKGQANTPNIPRKSSSRRATRGGRYVMRDEGHKNNGANQKRIGPGGTGWGGRVRGGLEEGCVLPKTRSFKDRGSGKRLINAGACWMKAPGGQTG
ncbi:hypothetical protein DFH07DRAFT_775629 [Mycena maculata]|uniref:Secreted protein n=1 Tax=Mycena maculata TaxID=230809 RepID=A0AAD7IUA2_9AGAR|nr:hypothetical protein DFH07DRAFT_775629 [Mycena maculata]